MTGYRLELAGKREPGDSRRAVCRGSINRNIDENSGSGANETGRKQLLN